jgi:hypothetical protein
MSRGSRRLAVLLLIALTAAAVPVAVVSFLTGCRCESLRL